MATPAPKLNQIRSAPSAPVQPIPKLNKIRFGPPVTAQTTQKLNKIKSGTSWPVPVHPKIR